jgi:hypothetical protein
MLGSPSSVVQERQANTCFILVELFSFALFLSRAFGLIDWLGA